LSTFLGKWGCAFGPCYPSFSTPCVVFWQRDKPPDPLIIPYASPQTPAWNTIKQDKTDRNDAEREGEAKREKREKDTDLFEELELALVLVWDAGPVDQGPFFLLARIVPDVGDHYECERKRE
jgi:hypothetical protein